MFVNSSCAGYRSSKTPAARRGETAARGGQPGGAHVEAPLGCKFARPTLCVLLTAAGYVVCGLVVHRDGVVFCVGVGDSNCASGSRSAAISPSPQAAGAQARRAMGGRRGGQRGPWQEEKQELLHLPQATGIWRLELGRRMRRWRSRCKSARKGSVPSGRRQQQWREQQQWQRQCSSQRVHVGNKLWKPTTVQSCGGMHADEEPCRIM